jgi:MFS family permease
LTSGVAGVGAASLFSDAGHEIATSLLPTLLTGPLHAGPGALGAVEGVSDALVGLAKLAGGPLATNPDRRARIASGGYLGTALFTGLIGVASAVWQVGVLRALAWVSRGIRSPARDTLLVSLVPPAAYGRASGLERAGDNLGALIGPLLAAGLVSVLGVRHTILLAAAPGVLAAAAITLAAREARSAVRAPGAGKRISFNLRQLHRAGLGRVLTPAACFELGNLATTLLILRATDLLHDDGRSLTGATSLAILLYAMHNAVAAVAALAAGHLVDRVGPRSVFAAGAIVYLASYAVFAVTEHSAAILAAAFAMAGIGVGAAETVESATVALSLPDELRATGYGALGLLQSAGDLGATLVAGLLWAAISPAAAFAYAAAWMAISALTGPLLAVDRKAARSG